MDLSTLHITDALVNVTCGLTCLSIWGTRRTDACLAFWGFGLALYGLVSSLLPFAPAALIWNSIGYSGLEFGVVLIWCGFRAFDGMRPLNALLLALPLAPVLTCLLVWQVTANLPLGDRTALLVHCAIAAGQATYVLRRRTGWLRPRSISAYAMYAISASVALPALTKGMWLDAGTAEVLIALVDHAMTIVFTLAVIAMVGERDFQAAVVAARRDPLTGALNRTGLAQAIAGRTAWQTLLLVDLDHFKIINDRFGHGGGDEVLRDFTGRTSQEIGEAALLARMGGEEFLIVADNPCIEQGKQLAEQIRCAASSRPVLMGEVAIPFTVSIGVTLCRGHADFEQAVKRADEALYRAKADGRNCIVTA